MKNAIIIGASSGIGRELALQLSAEGYRLCVTARRRDLLEELLLTLGDDSFMQEMDVADTDSAIELFTASVEKMGSVDLVILCAGTGFIDSEMPWENDSKTIGLMSAVLRLWPIQRISYSRSRVTGIWLESLRLRLSAEVKRLHTMHQRRMSVLIWKGYG